MKKSLFIYGAGGLGREVLSMIRPSNEWEPAGFVDDSLPAGMMINGLRVAGGLEFLNRNVDAVNLVVAIGSPLNKSRVISAITNKQISFPVLIHPSVIIQDRSTISLGNGTIICAGCILTTNISIGEHTLINLKVTVGHDVTVGSMTSIMPGVNIAGNVSIGKRVLIGSGSNIINHVTIGEDATVGMGAVVLKSVHSGDVVAGIPAKSIKR